MFMHVQYMRPPFIHELDIAHKNVLNRHNNPCKSMLKVMIVLLTLANASHYSDDFTSLIHQALQC